MKEHKCKGSLLEADPHSTAIGQMNTLKEERAAFQPPLPHLLQGAIACKVRSDSNGGILFEEGGQGLQRRVNKVGVLFSGGPAPGGHNVIVALYDALKRHNPQAELIGFLGGVSGLLKNDHDRLGDAAINEVRNQPGFSLLGSGRTKIQEPAQFEAARQTALAEQLDGLVIIGGDDSNTNAWMLAEYFKKHQLKTQVIGVPKTIDGDLQNQWVEISFGFDTACRIYSEIIGNIASDALSARKYYHFIKLMGRSASHVTLECALQTQPNLTFIAEEVKANHYSLKQIVGMIVEMIEARAEQGKEYGVILIPEGLFEFIPEMAALIDELNKILAEGKTIEQNLSSSAKELFVSLPEYLKNGLLSSRDPHGNVQFSEIATEKLLVELTKMELRKRGSKVRFAAQTHFLGYEGRSAYPTNFDATYCTALGATAALLLQAGVTGYMAYVKGLTKPVQEWQVGGVALERLIEEEKRGGTLKPVIKRVLVDLEGPVFSSFAVVRKQWICDDCYQNVGPIQFFGPQGWNWKPPLTLMKRNG